MLILPFIFEANRGNNDLLSIVNVSPASTDLEVHKIELSTDRPVTITVLRAKNSEIVFEGNEITQNIIGSSSEETVSSFQVKAFATPITESVNVLKIIRVSEFAIVADAKDEISLKNFEYLVIRAETERAAEIKVNIVFKMTQKV